MIRLGKNKTLGNYFIDENGVITDENGNIQEVKIWGDRPCFKGLPVHRIMMYTFYGYRDGHKWDIHHLDENKHNNALTNLVYLTRSEHVKLHHEGKHHSEDSRKKISEANKGRKHSEESKQKISDGRKGKHHSEETKQKISEVHKGSHHSEESKRKMSESKKGKHHSEETKQKISEVHKGKNTWIKGLHWFNDGIKSYMCKECPPGCVPGRIG